MSEMVGVVGGGAWGTALAVQAARRGPVRLWLRDPARAAALAAGRENPRLPGVTLPAAIEVIADAARLTGLILLAVPTQHLRGVAAGVPAGDGWVICAKGIERGSLEMPLEIIAARRLAVLTGPNFAGEVARGLPAAAVVAAADAGFREAVAARLGSAAFRLYGSDDPVGAQVGGAAKNVVAIAAGAVIGAGLGENARAALVTRGLAEIARLAVALGGRAETVAGLSGLGDLLLTCTGPASRNYRFGLALGAGGGVAAARDGAGGVVEGMATAPALVERAARAAVEMPICSAVAALLAGATTLPDAIATLLGRPRRDE